MVRGLGGWGGGGGGVNPRKHHPNVALWVIEVALHGQKQFSLTPAKQQRRFRGSDLGFGSSGFGVTA